MFTNRAAACPLVCGNHLHSLCLLVCPRAHHRCIALSCLLSVSSGQLSERSLYDLLGVASDASQHDIKCAYFTKCKTLHPDTKCDGATKNDFLELKQAYDVLRRPAERRRYDNSFLHNRTMYSWEGQHWQDRTAFGGFSSGKHWQRPPLVDEHLHFVATMFLFGAVFVLLFYFAQWVGIRQQNKRLAALDDADELAKCFMRQRGMDASMLNDPDHKERLARLLRTDIEAAIQRRNEDPEQRTNPMEIREERRWMEAVKWMDADRKIQ